MQDLGWTDAPCVVVQLDKTQEKALNLALNKITDHMGRPRSFCSECSFIIVKIVYVFVNVIKGVFKSVLLCIFLYNRCYFFRALNVAI